jgi:hypothetical protein
VVSPAEPTCSEPRRTIVVNPIPTPEKTAPPAAPGPRPRITRRFAPSAGPARQSIAPIERLIAPIERLIAPIEWLIAPIEWLIAPIEWLIAPIKWLIAPIECLILPIEWLIVPIEWLIVPIEWLIVPIEWLIVPIEWPIAPIEWPIELFDRATVPAIRAEAPFPHPRPGVTLARRRSTHPGDRMTTPATTLQTILDQFREAARNNRDLGDRFERLILQYLKLDPIYTDRFSDVWMWNDFPDKGNVGDVGIDLVAQERGTGDYCAIQCKFYLPEHTLGIAGQYKSIAPVIFRILAPTHA